ncbi:hypothetical protein [Vreelandella alkaliphila]|uniref:hypothetical protein n=1 Tax=Vreelandella alkaliphila TaxID=272774 RepID=UPI003FD7A1AE
MNFYSSTHRHYCGIDLHARSLYACILNQQWESCNLQGGQGSLQYHQKSAQ